MTHSVVAKVSRSAYAANLYVRRSGENGGRGFCPRFFVDDALTSHFGSLIYARR